jgi:hypothetical protein
LLSGEAMKIKEDGPRQMMKDEKAYGCIVFMNVKILIGKKSGIMSPNLFTLFITLTYEVLQHI